MIVELFELFLNAVEAIMLTWRPLRKRFLAKRVQAEHGGRAALEAEIDAAIYRVHKKGSSSRKRLLLGLPALYWGPVVPPAAARLPTDVKERS